MDAVTARLHPYPQPFHAPSHHQPRFIAPGPREGRVGCVSPFAVASRVLMKTCVRFSLPVETYQRKHSVSGIDETESTCTGDFDAKIL